MEPETILIILILDFGPTHDRTGTDDYEQKVSSKKFNLRRLIGGKVTQPSTTCPDDLFTIYIAIWWNIDQYQSKIVFKDVFNNLGGD